MLLSVRVRRNRAEWSRARGGRARPPPAALVPASSAGWSGGPGGLKSMSSSTGATRVPMTRGGVTGGWAAFCPALCHMEGRWSHQPAARRAFRVQLANYTSSPPQQKMTAVGRGLLVQRPLVAVVGKQNRPVDHHLLGLSRCDRRIRALFCDAHRRGPGRPPWASEGARL